MVFHKYLYLYFHNKYTHTLILTLLNIGNKYTNHIKKKKIETKEGLVRSGWSSTCEIQKSNQSESKPNFYFCLGSNYFSIRTEPSLTESSARKKRKHGRLVGSLNEPKEATSFQLKAKYLLQGRYYRLQLLYKEETVA